MTAIQNALGWQGTVLVIFGFLACVPGGLLVTADTISARKWGAITLATGVLLLAASAASFIACAWAGVS